MAPNKQPKKIEPVVEKKEAEVDEEYDDLDDILLDDPAAFIERQSSAEVKVDLQSQFVDDPKALRRERELAKNKEENKKEEEKKQNDNKKDERKDARRNEGEGGGRGRNNERGSRGRGIDSERGGRGKGRL